MQAAPPTIALSGDFSSLLTQVREQLGEPLRALLMFGSCLSDRTRQPGSVPDLLAFVSDLRATVERLGCGPITRTLAGVLPPLTLALRQSTGPGRPLAKLNLIELAVAQRAVRELPDLYLAGRLSKPTAWLWHYDASIRREVEALLDDAAAAVADLTLRGVRGSLDLEALVQLYIAQSYLAELRPEGQQKWRALRCSFPAFYDQRVRPLLLSRAVQLGLRPLPTGPARPGAATATAPENLTLVDERPPDQRRADQRARARLLRRSRLRTLARWPKMTLVYRGWFPYLLGKLQRVLRQRLLRPAGRRDGAT